MTITLPRTVRSASLAVMTQLSAGASTPDHAALDGVTIQGGSFSSNAALSSSPLYDLSPAGEQLTCYVPQLSAVVTQTT